MSNNSFYFPHDNNSFTDDKLLAVRAKFKLEGYGLFWAILETMSRNDGYIIPSLIGGLMGRLMAGKERKKRKEKIKEKSDKKKYGKYVSLSEEEDEQF